MDVHTTARTWHDHGASVVPARADGTKAPLGLWKDYQAHRPDQASIDAWFSSGRYDGLGLITGAVSGGLEMLEAEGRATHLVADVAQILTDSGYGDLWRRLSHGYLEVTPSGGLHWLYRVTGEPVPPSRKLTRRPATPTELEAKPGDVVKVLFETRGEGGFTVVAPSAGRTHPTGKAWTILAGGPGSVPTITADERRVLHAVIAGFDLMPALGETAPADPLTSPGPSAPEAGERPGDEYNRTATWDDILKPHGWKRVRRLGRGWAWVRPGKDARDGISATTGQNAEHDRLYVFSTATVFEAERPYSKFGAYALLEHGGDHAAAARALADAGYGQRRDPVPPRPASVPAAPTVAQVAAIVDGPAAGEQPAAEIDHAARRHALLVDEELMKLRVRDEARTRYDDERRKPLPPFDAGLLGEILTRPPEPPYRVRGLVPADASTLVVAQRKTGKTTLALNLARSLLTGAPFLGRFDVLPVTGRVALLNYEVSAAQVARWADEHDVPSDRLYLVNLRGRRNPLAHDEDTGRLAAQLRSHDVETVIVDPFGRAYTGTSQNDAGEVQQFLVNLDSFAREKVGAKDLVLLAHAGWNGARTRGSSALEDWADSLIYLTGDGKDDDGESDNDDGPRATYFRATGRDVDVEEDLLGYEPNTRTLTMTGAGGKRQASAARRLSALKTAVMVYVQDNPGCSGHQLETDVEGRREVVREARRALVAGGALVEEPRTGRGGGVSYRVAAPETRTSPNLAQPRPVEVANLAPPPYRGGGVRVQVQDDPLDDTRCARCAQPLSLARQTSRATLCPGCDR